MHPHYDLYDPQELKAEKPIDGIDKLVGTDRNRKNLGSRVIRYETLKPSNSINDKVDQELLIRRSNKVKMNYKQPQKKDLYEENQDMEEPQVHVG